MTAQNQRPKITARKSQRENQGAKIKGSDPLIRRIKESDPLIFPYGAPIKESDPLILPVDAGP
jgi:hypothetical protein